MTHLFGVARRPSYPVRINGHKTNLLNDLQIRRLIAARQPEAISDGGGLTFTLSKAGTASWVLRYRLPGNRRKEVTLGNYSDLSLAAAREHARALRVDVDRGLDPSADKREAKTRDMRDWTVRQLIEHYLDKHLTPANYSETTIYYRLADINLVILPNLGNWPASRITSIDVVHTLQDSKRTWTMTKRLLTSIHQRLLRLALCIGVGGVAIGPGPRTSAPCRINILSSLQRNHMHLGFGKLGDQILSSANCRLQK